MGAACEGRGSGAGGGNLTLCHRDGGCGAAHRLAYNGRSRPVKERDANYRDDQNQKVDSALPFADADAVGVFLLDGCRVEVRFFFLDLGQHNARLEQVGGAAVARGVGRVRGRAGTKGGFESWS